MSVLIRRLLLMALGLLAGVAAWPATEWILYHQGSLPSYLVFSILLGAVFGILLGAFTGSSEGIFSSVRVRSMRGALTGAATGLAGGVLGFLVGQGLLFLVGELLLRSNRTFLNYGVPLARTAGWAVLGIFVGLAEGIRARSAKKLGIGALGGLLGGLTGGLILEYSRLLFPQRMYARLAGLAGFGLLVGLFYGLVERRFAYGVLRVLNGGMRGKEYLITQDRLRVGRNEENEVRLAGYTGVGEEHAVLSLKGEDVLLRRLSPRHPVYVNEEPITERALKFEDVIRIGSVKLFYRFG